MSLVDMTQFTVISIDGRHRIIHNDVMMLIDCLAARNEHNLKIARVALKMLRRVPYKRDQRIGVAVSALMGICEGYTAPARAIAREGVVGGSASSPAADVDRPATSAGHAQTPKEYFPETK